jgi:hypothetical protein
MPVAASKLTVTVNTDSLNQEMIRGARHIHRDKAIVRTHPSQRGR